MENSMFSPFRQIYPEKGEGGRMTVKETLHIYVRSYYVPDTVLGVRTIVLKKSNTESLLPFKSSYTNRGKALFNMLII